MMAPQKQPKTLLDLARNEVGKLVLKTCIDIDSSYGYNDPSWQENVDILQTLLVEHIPASEWDNMCDVVLRERRTSQRTVVMRDTRVIYATLVHRHMKKLAILPFCKLTKGSRFFRYHACKTPPGPLTEEVASHRDFWLQHVGKLVNIETLEMLCIGWEEIFAVIGETCKNLKRLSCRRASIEMITLLKNCTKLRSLSLDPLMMDAVKKALEMFPDLENFDCNMNGVFETLDVTRPLNLRCVPQYNIRTPLYISVMVPLCPNLTALNISPNSIEDSAEIFKILAASSLRLTDLHIDNFMFDQNMENFLKVKGNLIDSLGMYCSETDLYSGILCVALHCSNVSKLTVFDHRIDIQDSQNQIIPDMGSCFKHLKHFRYKGYGINSLEVPDLIISRSACLLSSLEINMSQNVAEDAIMELLHASRLTEIEQLNLSDCVDSTLLCHVYLNCPKLTSLTVFVDIDDEANYCTKFLRNHVSENNLDLDIITTILAFGSHSD